MNEILENYMDYINHRFISYFGLESKTKYKCPYCKVGDLITNKDDVNISETPESKKDRYDPDWEQEWVTYTFNGALTCKECHEKTFCIGKGKLEYYSYCGPEDEAPDSINECYELELTPTYFEPTIFIFGIPSKCPENLKIEIENAFKLAFSDYSASGNRVRTCIELYIMELNPSATGNLHHKIESIKTVDINIYEILMAIKWLGNQGSHESNLKECDLAFAFEALEFCLNKTYDSNENKLKKLAGLINDSKGSLAKN